MSHNPKFQEFLAFGEALEQASQQHLFPKLFPFCDAYRIGSEKVWRSFGADYLLLDNRRNRALLVEVKADTKTTGNLAVETYSISANTAQRTYGWFHTSKADYIVYISIPQRRVLILDLPKLRGMLHERKFPLKSTQLNVGYTAYFYLIPWDWALVEFPSITIPEEEWSRWEETIQEHLQKEPA
jgi:hypothetical protein